MHTTRTRVFAPRKSRVWVTSEINIALSLGLTPVLNTGIGTDFRNKVGREPLPSDTLAHSWCRGVLSQSAAGDSSTQMFAFGLGFLPTGQLAANAPNVLAHDGDWQMHWAAALLEPTTLQTPLIPQEISAINIESAGSRSFPKAFAYQPMVVAESSGAPSSGAFEFRLAFTTLWLLAS